MRRRSRPTFEVEHLRRVLVCRILGGVQSPGVTVDRHYVVMTAGIGPQRPSLRRAESSDGF